MRPSHRDPFHCHPELHIILCHSHLHDHTIVLEQHELVPVSIYRLLHLLFESGILVGRSRLYILIVYGIVC